MFKSFCMKLGVFVGAFALIFSSFAFAPAAYADHHEEVRESHSSHTVTRRTRTRRTRVKRTRRSRSSLRSRAPRSSRSMRTRSSRSRGVTTRSRRTSRPMSRRVSRAPKHVAHAEGTRIFNEALDQSLLTDSYSVSGAFQYTDHLSDIAFDLSFTGGITDANSLSPQQSIDLDLDVTVPGKELGAEGNLTIGMSMGLVMLSPEEFYVNLKDIRLPIELALYTAILPLDDLTDQWVRIDFDEIAEDFNVPAESFNASYSTSDELLEYLKEHNPLVITGVSDDIFEGTPVHKLTFALNSRGLSKFVEAFLFNEEVGISAREARSMNRAISTFMRSLRTSNAVMYVGKEDKQLHHLAFTGSHKSRYTNATFHLEETIKDFNRPMTIEAPANSVSFKEYIEGLEAFAALGLPVNSIDSVPSSDVDSLLP